MPFQRQPIVAMKTSIFIKTQPLGDNQDWRAIHLSMRWTLYPAREQTSIKLVFEEVSDLMPQIRWISLDCVLWLKGREMLYYEFQKNDRVLGIKSPNHVITGTYNFHIYFPHKIRQIRYTIFFKFIVLLFFFVTLLILFFYFFLFVFVVIFFIFCYLFKKVDNLRKC